MVECIQEPGETIFVPAGWWHVVLNRGFTIAVTQNLLFPCQLQSVWPQLKAKHPSFAAQFAGYLRDERPSCKFLLLLPSVFFMFPVRLPSLSCVSPVWRT